MGDFDQLLANLDPNSRVRGRQFEHICKWFLTNDPTYRSTLRRVWLWDEWVGRWGGDAGIDLVAEDHDGRLWAIQAKAYDPVNTVTKADVDKFLAESSRAVFSYRLLIATTDKLHHVARRTINDQEKQVAFVGLSDLLTSEVDWPTDPLDMRPSPPPKPARPREHQREAIRDVVKGFTKSDRGQLIMACGTGKTLTSLFIKEKLAAERTLVLVPSLSLLKQTMQVWRVNTRVPFEALPVCADVTVGRSDADAAVAHTSELGLPVTTDPHDIAAFLRRRSGPRVVFSTYQSSPQIAAAFAVGRVPAFDLVVADEAHRVAGIESSDFATVLDETAIKARRLLFMTATPRYFTGRVLKAAQDADLEVASMDDTSKFGTVFHRLTFSEAIKRNLLTDYQVAVVGVDDDTYLDWAEKGTLVTLDGKKVTDARTLAGQIGLAKAMQKYDLHRTISFHSRVARAREFASETPGVIAWMPARQRPKGVLWSSYASGEMTAGERHVRLQHLGRLDDGQRGLLANARCLAEGVDVPTLDGVAFIDPRRSEVDIVQAVGRAIRKSAHKTVGTIVIPVFIDTDTDPEIALTDSAFKPVWEVIQALRAHDEVLGEQLDSLRREMGRRGGIAKLPNKIHLDLPLRVGTDFAAAFEVRLVEQTTASWEFWYGLLEKYVAEHGTALVPFDYAVGDWRLGRWVIKQRAKKAAGHLSDYRTEYLGSLPGWSWDTAESKWEEGFQHLLRYVGHYRHTAIPAQYRQDGYRLGQWVTLQRQNYNRKTLEPDRLRRLEEVPGWVWNPIGDRWEIGFGHLCRYVEEYGIARPPQDCVLDGYSLGSWVATQRGRYNHGALEIERQRRLEALPGWVWDTRSARWEETFDLLCRYVEQYGDAAVPQGTIFEGAKLGQWVAVVRDSKKNGTLGTERERRLEELPGWMWDTISERWDTGYRHLCEYVAEHGSARLLRTYTAKGYRLGSWVTAQRAKKAAGRLDEQRVRKLEELPGWTWDTIEDKWEEGLRRLTEYAKENGHARVPPKYVTDDGYKLGQWVSNLRMRRSGLDPEKACQVEAVPGWTWDPYAEQWDEGFRYLVDYVKEYGDARPPRDFVSRDGFRLGQWVTVQRVTKLRKRMDEQRSHRLENLHGWSWDPRADAWEEGFQHLAQFLKESGGVRPPQLHVCTDGFKLGVWASTQRANFAKGTLSTDRQKRLEKLKGWDWKPPRGPASKR